MTQVAKKSRMEQIRDLEHARDFYDDDRILHHGINDDDTDNDCHDVDGCDCNSNVFITPPYIDSILMY